jgi:4-amino-4-deoxy-L-arabinose transferase-like glycosyltransferase
MDNRAGLLDRQLPWNWLLGIAGALLFIHFIGGVHLFDWDEINFAEISREMIATGDYLPIQVNYKSFFEKPPFFMWLQVLSMKAFGINEFAARLPNAIAGMITLVLLYRLGLHWLGQRFGVLWALMYLGAVLPTLYHKSGIIDPWFNLFIFAGLMAWTKGALSNGSVKWFVLSGLLSGMAVLTKGPVGPLLIGLAVIGQRLVTRDGRYLPLTGWLQFMLGNIIIAGLWFGVNWMSNGPDWILAFLRYQVELLTESVAGHKGFPGYHFVVALFGIFPASLFALGGIFSRDADNGQPRRDLRRLMIVLLVVVLVLFSIVQSKIVHYSSMAYFPVAFLAACMLEEMLDERRRMPAWIKGLAGAVTLIVVSLIWLFPIAGMNIQQLPELVKVDAFTAKAITAPVHWGILDLIPALWLTILLVAAFMFWKKKQKHLAVVMLSLGMAIWVNLALIFFIGKVERYTQYAAVEFCASKAGQAVTITPVGYKSYLPFFYAKKPAPGKLTPTGEEYFILREDKRKRLEQMPDVEILYERHGYIFLQAK